MHTTDFSTWRWSDGTRSDNTSMSFVYRYVLWSGDAQGRQRSDSTLAHVIDCCLTAPRLLISGVLWHLPEDNFAASAQYTLLYHVFVSYTFKIIALLPHLPGGGGGAIAKIRCWFRHLWYRHFLNPILIQIHVSRPRRVNSCPPNDAYMHQWTGSTLFQMMACRLFDAKPLSKPMLVYCQLGPHEESSVEF